MDRPRQLLGALVCGALLAAACGLVGSATAATSKADARKHPRRATCATKRHRGRHARRNSPHGRRRRPAHHATRRHRSVRCHAKQSKRRRQLPVRRPAPPAKLQPASPTSTPTAGAVTPTAGSGSTPGGTASGLDVGVVTSIAQSSDEATRMSDVESKSGAKWLREMFDWSTIEPQNGTYDFSRYDTLMTLASRNSVHVLAELFTTPSWAGSTPTTIPDDPSAFAAFVAAVVSRYGPHGSFWASHPGLVKDPIETFELWNEPYYSNGNSGDYNPGRYARLVKAAASAGYAVDPSAKFLLAAENQSASVNGTWVWWIDALYAAVPDLNNYFDGVAVHPYGTDLTDLTYPTFGQAYTGYDQVRRVESIHQEFAAHNAPDKPLWITEVGWPTCTNGGSVRCTTPAGQASNIQTVFTDARTIWKSFIRAVFIYGYQDNNADTADPENDYGLIDFGGTPKPALSVFKANN